MELAEPCAPVVDAEDFTDLCSAFLRADELGSALLQACTPFLVAESSFTSRSAFRQACTTFLWADTSSDVFCTRVVEAGVSSHVCRSSTIGADGEATCEYV